MKRCQRHETAPLRPRGLGVSANRRLTDEQSGRQSQTHNTVNGNAARPALDTVTRYHLPVFPFALVPKSDGSGRFDKIPCIKGWSEASSLDGGQIREWWREWPQAYVGIPTGAVSGIWLLDIDRAGEPWRRENADRLGDTLRYRTRSGGWHYIYRLPAGVQIGNSSGRIADGVDTRGEGGFIAFWGAYGGAVGRIQAAPDWLIAQSRKPRVRRLNGHTPQEEGCDWRAERPRIIQALAQLDPDMPHDDWRDVASALSWASGGSAEGEELFVAFSKGEYWRERSEKYPGDAQVRAKYRSFYNDKDDNVTLATLYQMVKDNNGKVPGGRPEREKNTQPRFKSSAFRMSFDTLREVQGKSVADKPCYIGEWLYPGAWLVVGRPKIGKSWLLMQMLMDLSRGDLFLGYRTRLAKGDKILALFAEDDDARLKARSLTYGKASRDLIVINRERFLSLAQSHADGGEFTDWLDGYLAIHREVRIVMIDTEETSRLVWKTKQPQEKSRKLTSVDYEQTSRFDTIALRRNVAILLVNHSNKLRTKAGDNVDIHEIINRTNTALAGASGSIVMADVPDADRLDPTEKRRLFGVRGRDVEEEVLCVLDRPNTRFINSGPYHEMEQTMAEQALLTELRAWHDNGDVGEGEYVSAHDLAKALGKRWDTVRHTVRKMLKSGRTQWNGYRILTSQGRHGGIRLEKIAR